MDNFGSNGDKPSHPELLDYLATSFIKDGWSVKRLVRNIVLSRVYRLSADKSPAAWEVDPANRLLWRHSPRRLDAEEVRDTILAVSGHLNLNPEAATAVAKLRMVEIRDNGLESRSIHDAADASRVRSIYLPLARGLTPRTLEPFDPVTQTLVTGQRERTTVPTQALFLLNSAFVRRQALALANAVLSDAKRGARPGIREVYLRILNREPSPAEVERAARFLDTEQTEFAREPAQKMVVAKTAPLPAPRPADPDDPDNVDRTDYAVSEELVQASDARSAAWLDFIQALFSSAEFRFVR